MNLIRFGYDYEKKDVCITCGGIIEGKSCIDCGNIEGDYEYRLYGQSKDNIFRKYFNKVSTNKQVFQVLQEEKPKRKKLRVKYDNYKSFNIEVDENTKKIKNIRFHFKCIDGKNKNFEIDITDYKVDKVRQGTIYGGDVNIVRIKDLKIGLIKVKINKDYGKEKERVNYYKHLGLDFFNAKRFIENALKQYHQNN